MFVMRRNPGPELLSVPVTATKLLGSASARFTAKTKLLPSRVRLLLIMRVPTAPGEGEDAA